MSQEKKQRILNVVRKNYADIAETNGRSCCCGDQTVPDFKEISRGLGYSQEEVDAVPEGANMGLGCGNPQAIASLKPGEKVVDLGSGGGFDCFLAGKSVGESGQAIGVDMTPEMIAKSRENAEKMGIGNVTFRLGEIEHLPVADNSMDVVMSNCVINLSPDKPQVYSEAWRVLKPGGRLAISDIVATAELPADARENMELYSACMAGAPLLGELETMLRNAGFTAIQIRPNEASKEFIKEWVPGSNVHDYLVSSSIQAIKPAK
ncbi:MAG: arsenite methyltransferase [Deferribacteres bacterium]|nr:arsenite methyltransferase [candidate division KSB1 bacterium]MCB9503959.1 arsenite methyltransferase [Deferribacteres bacterium]